MEEKLEYRLTYLTETLEDMKREMIRIRTIMSNSRKTHYTNQEVMELLQITSATLKKWRDNRIIGYSAVGNTYFYTDKDSNTDYDRCFAVLQQATLLDNEEDFHCFMLHLTYIFCGTKVLMFDETHAMQISEYLCFTYQIVAFFSGSKKSHEFGTIEIPKSACFAQLKQKENL